LTSDRQRRANQADAKASTGPKTRAGKERAAQNALRHGLSIPVSSDPALSPQAEAIARRIAGPYATPLRSSRRAGSARLKSTSTGCAPDEWRWSLTRSAIPIISGSLSSSIRSGSWGWSIESRALRYQPLTPRCSRVAIKCKPLEGLEKLAMILQERASELARLDRYERRALSRRKSVIREFDAAHALTKL
jgi:hypothetical protein